MNKKMLLLSSFFVAILWFAEKQINSWNPPSEMQTFIKKPNQRSLASYPTSPKEANKLNISQKKKQPLGPKRGIRYLRGEEKERYQSQKMPLSFSQAIDKKWKEKLAHSLLRFQSSSIKLIVKNEIDIIHINRGQGHYQQQVLISFLDKNGRSSSYRALIDSSNGEILKTWDRQKVGPHRRLSLKLTPSIPLNPN